MISHDDLVSNLGYINSLDTAQTGPSLNGTTPTWVYNSRYYYWTMSQYGDSSYVWYVDESGKRYFGLINRNMVRPVLELNKSADITMVS